MKYLTHKEKLYYTIWVICKGLNAPIAFIGNWAVDKLNKSYYFKSKQQI